MNATIPTALSPAELADRIVLTVHPSNLEFGPIADGLTHDRAGRWAWATEKYTRLELPGSPAGFGLRWIDYPTHREAREARDRVAGLVSACDTPESAWQAVEKFYRAE